MQERFNAKISADISSFLRKMSQVDKKIKETAFECTKPIDADVKRAMAKMERVDQKAKELAKESTKDVDANVTKAIAKLNQVNEKAREVSREESKPIDADITRAKRKLDEIKIIATQWSKDYIKKPVTLDISEYRKKMAELKASESGLRKKIEVSVHADTKGFTAKLNALLAKKRDYHINVKARTALFRKEIANLKAREIGKEIFLQIRARNERFYRDLDNIAESIRSWGVVLGNILKGTFIAVIPSIAAFGAAATGALATVGAMAGVLTGGLLGLTSAFGVAGAAIGAFAVTAVGHMKKFKDFMKGEGPGTKEMEALRDSVNGLKEDHKKLSDQLESNNFETFNNGVQAARKVLNKLNGLMVDSSGVMKNLSKSLNESMDSAPMERFFNYLNSNGASTLDKVARGVGFFGRSLASLVVAFGPLAASMSQGFLDMSKRVDEWSAKLADSQGMKQFTNYVNENMPKIRGAFRDLAVGLVQMFAAFGPMAATAMSWFERLMGRFREWSSQLSQNQAFKNFVKYIEEAAPKVGQLIGNLAKTFSLLAQGMAPLALSILNVANAFLQWFNALMQTNPGVAQLIAKMITLAGVALAVVPALTLIHSWFTRVQTGVTAVSEVFSRVGVSMLGVVATIAVVVAAFVHLYNTNQTTHDLMNSIWTNIKQLFVTFAQIAMQAINMVVSVLGSLVSAAAPVINVVLSIVNAFLSWLNQTLQNNQWLRTLIATVLAAAGAFRLIVTVVTTVRAAMTVLSAAVNASKVALVAWGAVSSVVSAAGTVITTVLAAVRVAFISLLGPWGIVAAVIIGGLVTLYNKCEWFRNAVDAVFKAIGSVFKWIGDKIGQALEYVGLKSKESSQQVSESMDQVKNKAQESGEGTAAAAEGAASRIAQSSASASASLDGMGASFANLDASAIAHFTSISNSMMSLTGIGSMGALTNITGMVMNSDMQFMQMSNSANMNMAAVNTAATTNTAMAAENVNANLSSMTLNSNAQLDALSANASTQFSAINSAASTQTGLMPGVVGANMSQVDMAAQTSLNNVSMTNQATWENVANTANTATTNLVTGVVTNFQNMQSQVQSAMQGVTSAVEQGCSQVQSSTSSTFSSVASNISSTMASISSNISSTFSSVASNINSIMATISSNISSSFSTISSTVQQAASQMEQTLQNAFNNINNVTSNSMSQLENRIRQAQSTVVSTVQQMGSQAVSTLQSYYGQFVSAGGYLMDGFIAGMQSRAGAVMATAMSIANAAAAAIRSALAIHSPSRVVAKITRWVPMGMVVGMQDTAKKAINYAGKLATQVADNINYAVSPANLNSDINNIGVTRNDIISGEVRTEYDFSKRPMQLNLQLGNNAFGKFVDDVNSVNKHNIQLEEVYSI
jgi:phage-related protein